MGLKIKILIAILFITMCNKQVPEQYDMRSTCGMSYSTSELFFEEDTPLGLRLRVVYFKDSCVESHLNYIKFVEYINAFFAPADITFKITDSLIVVDSEKNHDMPAFVKYNFKNFRNDTVFTIYIYSDYQPNYSNDQQFVLGVAGGIGSNFVAIKRSAAYSPTIIHEILHGLSLTHTFTPTDTRGYDIYTSDKVCDTRYINNESEKVDGDCNFIGNDDLDSHEKQQIVCNIMSYNHSNCRNCITEGQIRRIRFYIHESPAMRMLLYKGLTNVRY